jgi:stage III sporulation protein AB
MKSEICTRLTPLPELFELLARQTREPANLLFADCLIKLRSMRGRPFAEVWKAALKSSGVLELNDGELEILIELGSALGRYDVERQGEAIATAKKRLEACLAKAESERDKESKTRAVLGIAAGVAIAIILL